MCDNDVMAGLRERKKAELKRRIAETALTLVLERGYEATTIDEIVRRVDISQPTFYKYYSSKDAILREHALAGFASLLHEVFVARAKDTSIVEGLRRYFRALATKMTSERALWYAIAISNAYNPIRDPELLTSEHAGTRTLEAILDAAQRAGELTPAYTPRRLASLLEGIMFRICVEWGAEFPHAHALTTSVDEGFELFLRAARPQVGDQPKRSRRRA